MSMFQRKRRQVPMLNTASLPDLIFTVLFFFMLVTHMRKVTLKVKYRVPQGTELTRLTKKSAVSYVHVGTPLQGAKGQDWVVQLNDKVVSTTELADYLSAEQWRMSPADREQATVSLKADGNAPMGVVTDVKKALRQAKALRIVYAGTEQKQNP